MKALLVDDDEISRMPLAAVLGRLPGITEVVEAEDGEQAWELLQGGLRPLLCCCDLFMPRLDGVGLLQRTRAEPLLAHVPFVMISSAADRESVTRAIAAGAAGFLVKPYVASAVAHTLERVMREGRLRVAEPASQVRRRLGVSQDQLAQMMQRWRSDASSLLEDPAGLQDDAQRRSVLRRLHSASVTLGQLRGAELLRDEVDAPADTERTRARLREVLLLADAWLDAGE